MLTQIASHVFSTLTQSELTLLRYIEQHQQQVVEMKIQQLADANYTSTATVLRLCKKLGFEGFSELKYHLKSTVRQTDASTAAAATKTALLRENLRLLEQTSRLFDCAAFETVCRWLLSSRKIHLYAGGLSAPVLDYMQRFLLSAGRPCRFYSTAPLGYRAADHMNAQDVLIIASASGSTPSVVRIAQIAKNSGAQVVSITSLDSNPLAQLADIRFFTFIRNRDYYGTDIKARTPLFYVVSTILECYLFRRQLPATANETEPAVPSIPMVQHPLDQASGLSNQDQKLLQVILSLQSSLHHMTIQELADTVYTSPASIVRLCKKLEMEGFNELKYHLRRNVTAGSLPDAADELKGVIERHYQELAKTAALLTAKELKTITAALCSDKNIYLFARGLSYMPITYLHQVLLSVDRDCLCYIDPPLMCNAALNMNENDVVLIVSSGGATEGIHKAAKLAKEHQATVIALTSDPDSPVSQLADITLNCLAASRYLNTVDIKSRTTMVFAIDVILDCYLNHLNLNPPSDPQIYLSQTNW